MKSSYTFDLEVSVRDLKSHCGTLIVEGYDGDPAFYAIVTPSPFPHGGKPIWGVEIANSNNNDEIMCSGGTFKRRKNAIEVAAKMLAVDLPLIMAQGENQ